MTKILFKDNLPNFRSRIDYVLNFIEHHPLTQNKIRFTRDDSIRFDLKLYYGTDSFSDTYNIPSQKVFFSDVLPQFDFLKANPYIFDTYHVYAVEVKSKPPGNFIQDHHFQFDILETIFFHISRFEEWYYLEGREDEHGRMDSKHQFLVKNKLQLKPVVDQLIFCFLKAFGIDIKERKTQFRMTHDIDFIVKRNDRWGVLKSMIGAILKRGKIHSASKIWQNRHLENPYDTFDWMLRKEKGIEKIIYFLVGGKSKFDNPCDLQIPVFKKTIQLCKERGYQIGIHPSYQSWKNKSLMQKERDKLQEAIGSIIDLTRQHFLRFSFKDTPKIIDALGLKEDSSLGYADQIGFRCGTGFAYYLYDFDNEKTFSFLETPLVVMDSALLNEGNFEARKIKKLLENFKVANQFNTKITYNFHNSRFYDALLQDIPLKALYESLFFSNNQGS